MYEFTDFIKLMNTKKIYSRYSNELVTFTERITSKMYKIKFGVFSDGLNMIDNIDECENDISGMYCVMKDGFNYNMEDFYAEFGAFEDSDTFYTIIETLIEDR